MRLLGINTNLRIDPKPILYTAVADPGFPVGGGVDLVGGGVDS